MVCWKSLMCMHTWQSFFLIESTQQSIHFMQQINYLDYSSSVVSSSSSPFFPLILFFITVSFVVTISNALSWRACIISIIVHPFGVIASQWHCQRLVTVPACSVGVLAVMPSLGVAARSHRYSPPLPLSRSAPFLLVVKGIAILIILVLVVVLFAIVGGG